MARLGTIDYSKWERMAAEVSSDEEMPQVPFQAPLPLHSKQAQEDDTDDETGDSMSCEDDEVGGNLRPLLTGTCVNCGSEEATKRCSRCQAAWFCDQDCQAAAWKSHAISCFPRSETEAWWGKLASGPELARDAASLHQERLEVRRAVAATYQRKKAAQEAAKAAAAARAREGQVKGDGCKGGKGQEKEETCAVCQCEFTVSGDSGEGICCPSSHFLCSECTGVYVHSVMNDLEASYPPKCSMCRAELPLQSFERQLSQRQQQHLAEFVAQRSLCENETMLRCPCGYMEVRVDKPVLWWCPMCKRGECQVCNQSLPSACEQADPWAYLTNFSLCF